MLQCVREFIRCKWTLNQHSDDQVHDCYVVVMKKLLGIFHNVFHMSFSVSPTRKELLQSYDVHNTLQAYQYYCSMQ